MNSLLISTMLWAGREDWLCAQLDKKAWIPDLSNTKANRKRWISLYQQNHFKLAGKLTPNMDDKTHPLPWWCDLFDSLPQGSEASPQENCLFTMLQKWEQPIGFEGLQLLTVSDRYSRWSSFLNEFSESISLQKYTETHRPGFWERYLRYSLKDIPETSSSSLSKKVRL